MSEFRKPLRVMENHVGQSPAPGALSDVRKLQALAQRPTPLPAPPTVEQQLEAARVAIRALLEHGRRPDIVAQAEHVLQLSAERDRRTA